MLTAWRLQCLAHIRRKSITRCEPRRKDSNDNYENHQAAIEREQFMFLNKFCHYALSRFNLGSNRIYDASINALMHMYAKATHNTKPSING